MPPVVYFDQQTGALHAIWYSNSIFCDDKTTFNVLFSHKMYNMNQKITKKNIMKGVYQHLGVTF